MARLPKKPGCCSLVPNAAPQVATIVTSLSSSAPSVRASDGVYNPQSLPLPSPTPASNGSGNQE
ncbi:hypothetical protein E2C01_033836 [Portunus trituberculatus]|uniref:Uncharacterized protein n=1 Tax=Portunus trituberculatus TaxID=210409 RepID=A0A5B7EYY7_PORTR|nr:hypothetical protein [Portunus trituberculatus]